MHVCNNSHEDFFGKSLSERIVFLESLIPNHYLVDVDLSAPPCVVYLDLHNIYSYLKETYSRE